MDSSGVGGGGERGGDDMDFLLALSRGEGLLGDAPWENNNNSNNNNNQEGEGEKQGSRRSSNGGNGSIGREEMRVSRSLVFPSSPLSPSTIESMTPGSPGHNSAFSSGPASPVYIGSGLAAASGRGGKAAIKSEELDSEVLKSNYVRNQSRRLSLLYAQLVGDGDGDGAGVGGLSLDEVGDENENAGAGNRGITL
jgi:hypothetical protein